MSGSKPQPRRGASRSSKAAAREAPADGRTMLLVKQTGVVVGVISAIIGLIFLLFPDVRPERRQPIPDASAAITGMVMNPRTTKGQFLDYSDQSKLGFTKQQLAVAGASVFARITIVGYRGKTLTLERQIVDAKTGNVIGQARDFSVTPHADKVTHRWWDWAPLRNGRGSYVMVIKLLAEQQTTAIACGQSPAFGGSAGSIPATPPRLCELDQGS